MAARPATQQTRAWWGCIRRGRHRHQAGCVVLPARVTPGKAQVGQAVTVTGDGFDGDCDVLLRWGDARGQVLAAAPVRDGAFSAEVRVPTGARGASKVVAQARAYGLEGQGCGAATGHDEAVALTVTGGPAARGRGIALQNRRIDAGGVDASTVARARASATPIHAIVQLHTLPLPGDLEALAALGVRPVSYLNARGDSGSAYLAALAPTLRADDPAFTRLVRGVHPLRAQDKIEASLAARVTPDQRAIDAQITFFADVPAATVEAALAAEGLTGASRMGSHHVRAVLNRGQLQRLSQVDAVQFVAAAAPAGQLDLDNSRALVNVDAVQGFVGNGIYTGLTGCRDAVKIARS